MFACVDFAGQDTSFEYLEPSNDKSAVAFYKSTGPILSKMIESNPNYKQEVGIAIIEFVKKIAGEEKTPKITGMLIYLPVPDIQKYMVNFDLFLQRVSQATQLLEQQAIVAQQN